MFIQYNQSQNITSTLKPLSCNIEFVSNARLKIDYIVLRYLLLTGCRKKRMVILMRKTISMSTNKNALGAWH